MLERSAGVDVDHPGGGDETENRPEKVAIKRRHRFDTWNDFQDDRGDIEAFFFSDESGRAFADMNPVAHLEMDRRHFKLFDQAAAFRDGPA